jgi:hypothetical protein
VHRLGDTSKARPVEAASAALLLMSRESVSIEASADDNELCNPVDPVADFQIGEHERALASHFSRIALHHLQAGADEGREVDLFDHQQVGAGDAEAALARILPPAKTSMT